MNNRSGSLNQTNPEGNKNRKKIKVYLVILVGLILGAILCCGLYVASEQIVKNHYNTLDIAILYDFLEDEAKSNENSIIVIGASGIGTATYAPLIDEILQSEGCNIPTYNCYIDGTTSLMTTLQINSIIKAHPVLVVYGVSYPTFPEGKTQDLIEEKILFSKDKFELTDDIKQFYTDEELYLLEKHPFELRGYLGRVLFPTNTRTGNYDTKEPIGIDRRNNLDKTKDYDSIVASAANYHPVISNESTREKEAFLYSVQKLLDNGIKVVVINLPIHPLASAQVPEDSRENLLNLLNSTNATVIDLERAYPDDSHFRDIPHSLWNGTLEFSHDLAYIILEELT